MKLKKWFNERVDKKRLIKAVVFGAAALIVYQGYLHLGIYVPKQEYIRQFVGLGAAVFAVIAVVNFFKAFKEGVIHAVSETFGKVFKRIAKLAGLAAEKIRKILGIPERGTRGSRTSDERSFFFSERRAGKKNTSNDGITKRKWKDLTSDTERLRFMFVKFVKKNTKKGKKYSVFSTPLENGRSWELKKEEGAGFFDSYTDARYGDGGYTCVPEDMKRYADITGVK